MTFDELAVITMQTLMGMMMFWKLELHQVNMAPSKLLLPLSFAALMGGTMTLIGASTNLVVLSMAAKKVPDLKMNIFEIGVVGVPITVAGLLYIFALSGKLLPDRLTLQNTTFNARYKSIKVH